jgi:transposase
MGSAISHQLAEKGKSMAMVTVGIDTAKNVFALNGVNEAGKPELVRP